MNRPKHLLILSGPMGTGHIQAANAIADYAAILYPNVKVTHWNTTVFMTPGLKFYFTVYYHFMLRYFPFVWRRMYNRSNVPPSAAPLFIKILKIWRQTFVRRLLRSVDELMPDYIICTHFQAAEVMAEAKATGRIQCPVGTVITDFSVHWNYIQPQLDLFFVANSDMRLITHLCGIPIEKICVSGCPIRPEFSQIRSPDSSLYRALGLPPEGRYVMVMMGGESIGRVEAITMALLKNFPAISVLAMSGRDSALFGRLQRLKDREPNRLFPIAYTPEICQYLSISFAVVTKPGGITCSECIALEKPMIIMDPIPGHEEKNALYLSTHGLAAMPETLCGLSFINLSEEAPWMKLVSENQRRHRAPLAAAVILEKMLGSTEISHT